jgi:hypothetical protein
LHSELVWSELSLINQHFKFSIPTRLKVFVSNAQEKRNEHFLGLNSHFNQLKKLNLQQQQRKVLHLIYEKYSRQHFMSSNCAKGNAIIVTK